MEPIEYPSLENHIVRLRPILEKDHDAIVSWKLDSEIIKWTGLPENNNLEIVKLHRKASEVIRQRGASITLAMADPLTDEILGNCDARRDPQDPDVLEIGYLLSASARGRGIATHAIRLLVDWLFDELKAKRIQALVHPDNKASIALLEKVGFQKEGVLRSYRTGKTSREDRVMFSLVI